MHQTFWTIGNGIFGSLLQISCSRKRFESVKQVFKAACIAFPLTHTLALTGRLYPAGLALCLTMT